jgi:hypothetical protein
LKLRTTILSLAILILLSGMFTNSSYTYAETGATEQSRKKKNTVSKNKGNSSFGQAYKEARKKGLKTFKWNGKSYTTEKRSPGSNSSASNKISQKQTTASYKNISFGKAYRDAKKKGLSLFTWNGKSYTTGNKTSGSNTSASSNKNKKQTSASYKNISFGKAYSDAKKKGFKIFKWNGKSYTTGTVKKTSNKKITNKKKNITSKKKKFTSKKKKFTKRKTTPKRKYTTTRTSNSPGTLYTPPNTNYENTGTREFKRESNPGNENFRKEPKKD